MKKVKRSTLGDKKFMSVSPSGRLIHYGAKGYGDYDLWKRVDPRIAEIKRRRYVKSHKAILMKDGTPAWKNPETAEYYAMRGTWNSNKGNPLFKKVVALRNNKLSRDERTFIAKKKKELFLRKSS